jgi:hypothetical protein
MEGIKGRKTPDEYRRRGEQIVIWEKATRTDLQVSKVRACGLDRLYDSWAQVIVPGKTEEKTSESGSEEQPHVFVYPNGIIIAGKVEQIGKDGRVLKMICENFKHPFFDDFIEPVGREDFDSTRV